MARKKKVPARPKKRAGRRKQTARAKPPKVRKPKEGVAYDEASIQTLDALEHPKCNQSRPGRCRTARALAFHNRASATRASGGCTFCPEFHGRFLVAAIPDSRFPLPVTPRYR